MIKRDLPFDFDAISYAASHELIHIIYGVVIFALIIILTVMFAAFSIIIFR